MPSMRSITRSTTRLIRHSMCADLLRQLAASTRRRPTWLPKQETPLASAQLRPCGRRATCSSQRASDSERQVVVVTNRVVRHPGDEQLLYTPAVGGEFIRQIAAFHLATSRCSLVSRARNTTPMPPSPSGDLIS